MSRMLGYRSGADELEARRIEWTAVARMAVGWCTLIAPILFAAIFLAVVNNITVGPVAHTYQTQPLAYACPAAVLIAPLAAAAVMYRRDRVKGLGLLFGLVAAVALHLLLFGCLAIRSSAVPAGPGPIIETID